MNEDSCFFSVMILLKICKCEMGPRTRTKPPMSPRSWPLQTLTDLSVLENFQPRPVNSFLVAGNIKYRILILSVNTGIYRKLAVLSGVPGPPGPRLIANSQARSDVLW